jgi:AmmeMemoRadiSam system protein B
VVHRVILLGPTHRVPFEGVAISSADVYLTPLGPVPVDIGALDALVGLAQVRLLDAAHLREHSLEVHLPFLQSVLEDFKVVPLVVGEASPDAVAEVLERLWGGRETLIVVSSDLSHYHDYATAQRLDAETTRRIETLSRAEIDGEHACGCRPVNGLLLAARSHGLVPRVLDLRNSGDTAGPRDRVVGYGAYAFA